MVVPRLISMLGLVRVDQRTCSVPLYMMATSLGLLVALCVDLRHLKKYFTAIGSRDANVSIPGHPKFGLTLNNVEKLVRNIWNDTPDIVPFVGIERY